MPDNKFAHSFAAIRQASTPEEALDAVAEKVVGSAPLRTSAVEQPARSARQSVIPGGTQTTRESPSHAAASQATRLEVPPERRGPGRPPGKRSDPEYRQITGLIRKDVHVAVLKQMLDEGRSRDMGVLLEELLERHYLKRT